MKKALYFVSKVSHSLGHVLNTVLLLGPCHFFFISYNSAHPEFENTDVY